MHTWTFEYTSTMTSAPVAAVVSADNVDLALKLLKDEFKHLGIIFLFELTNAHLIPFPTQTRKVRVLSNGN